MYDKQDESKLMHSAKALLRNGAAKDLRSVDDEKGHLGTTLPGLVLAVRRPLLDSCWCQMRYFGSRLAVWYSSRIYQ